MNMFTATDRPADRRNTTCSMTLRLMKFFMESTDWRRNSNAGNNGRTAKRENKEGKGKEREEGFAEECHSRITFMNCCEESQGES